MTLAKSADARKPFFTLPREIYEDAYFAIGEERPYSRVEAFADLAQQARWTDNCVVKKGQLAVSMPELAKAWKWSLKQVRGFMEALKRRGFIGLVRAHINGAWKSLITVMFSGAYAVGDATERAHERAHGGRKQGASIDSNKEKKKEDSCSSQAPNAPEPESGRVPDLDEDDPFAPNAPRAERAAGAGQSEASEMPEVEIAPQAAPDGAGPPNSAAPPKLYPDEFDNLWLTCPKREGTKGSKAVAFKSWKKLRAEERLAAQRGAEAWAKRVGDEISAYTPMASTWINQRRWETENEPDPKQPKDRDYHRKLEELYAAF